MHAGQNREINFQYDMNMDPVQYELFYGNKSLFAGAALANDYYRCKTFHFWMLIPDESDMLQQSTCCYIFSGVFLQFLDESTHLYRRVCPFVGLSVRTRQRVFWNTQKCVSKCPIQTHRCPNNGSFLCPAFSTVSLFYSQSIYLSVCQFNTIISIDVFFTKPEWVLDCSWKIARQGKKLSITGWNEQNIPYFS